MSLSSFFKLKEKNTTAKAEFIAALTTFSTLSYLLVVHPQILSLAGIDFNQVFFATILSSTLATLYMAFFANLPIALAPGMGLNAYFTYTLVLLEGFSPEKALAAALISSLLLLLLTLSGFRQTLYEAIPLPLKSGASCGIGLFLTFIGLKNGGLVIAHPETLLTIGELLHPKALLSFFGVIVAAALIHRKVPGALFIAILATWFAGSFFPSLNDPEPLKIEPIIRFNLPLFHLTLSDLTLIPAILSFLFVSLFDAAGTLYTLGRQLGVSKSIPKKAFYADALGSTIGALFGTSPLTPLLESSTGIAQGGKSGLCALFIACFFLLSLFMAPVFASVPLYALTPALLYVGALMVKECKEIPFDDVTVSTPAFITLVTIPFTFSIATGIALGFILYPLIKLLSGRGNEVPPLTWLLALLFSLKFILL